MWSQIPTPWQACLGLSWQSNCEGSLPIGAVITDSDGAIVARGRNRVGVREISSRQEITGNPLAHAEINALLNLDYDRLNPRQLILYSTVEPCPLCIGAICMAGVKQFYFAARDPWAGSANLVDASPYLRKKGITAYGPQGPALETLVHVLQAASEVHHSHPNVQSLLDVWAADHPHGVGLGIRLYRSGELRQLRAQGAPVEIVVNHIFALFNT